MFRDLEPKPATYSTSSFAHPDKRPQLCGCRTMPLGSRYRLRTTPQPKWCRARTYRKGLWSSSFLVYCGFNKHIHAEHY